jgi:hypothetical protein
LGSLRLVNGTYIHGYIVVSLSKKNEHKILLYSKFFYLPNIQAINGAFMLIQIPMEESKTVGIRHSMPQCISACEARCSVAVLAIHVMDNMMFLRFKSWMPPIGT